MTDQQLLRRTEVAIQAGAPPYGSSATRFKGGLKRTSFYPVISRYTSEYKLHNTYLKPQFITDSLEEYWAIRRAAALFDVTGEEVVELRGPDAVATMESVTPRRVASMSDGACRYAVLCYPYGGIVEDGIIVRFNAERLWWIGGPAFAEQVLYGASLGRDVQVRGRLDDWHSASLQGPLSRSLLQPLTEADLDRLGYYRMVETAVCGVPVVLLRAGYTAELGYDIFVRPEDGERLFGGLWDSLQPQGVRLAGSRALAIRRIEAGILNVGQDFDWTNVPQELGLGWMVKDPGPDFCAAEALARISAEGASRRIRGLAIDAGEAAPEGAAVLRDGRAAGRVTSPVLSPTLERSIAIAMLSAEIGLGERLEVEMGSGRAPAEVVQMPFLDPERRLSKA